MGSRPEGDIVLEDSRGWLRVTVPQTVWDEIPG